jgi:V-type H+-transporting ATPase subunit A
MAEPVTSATLSIVSVFWGLDKKLAQRKHFPSINWTISFSKYIRVLEPYMEEKEPEYLRLQQQFREILQSEDELQEIVQLVGKDSLSEDQKCTLETARIIREDFLQQNGFSEYDFMCTLPKTIGMMKVIGHFYDCAMKAITETGDRKVTWGVIAAELKDTITKVTEMKFEKPRNTPEQFKKTFNDLCDHITTKFRTLLEDH